MDKCLDNIEAYEKDIIIQTCIEGISLRQYARISGFSRDTITKERKRILSMLVRFFNMEQSRKECGKSNELKTGCTPIHK